MILDSSGDLDDLLLVPDVFPTKQCEADLWALGDLFSEDSSSEAATVLSLADTASDASTRLPNLCGSERQLSSTPRSEVCLPPSPVAALEIPPSGLNLKLDYGAVASAWSELGGGRAAIGMSTAELAGIAASIPSTADKAASLAAESVMSFASGADSESSQGPASSAPVTDEDFQARKAALARYKEKKSARVNNPSKKVRYEMRRINAEKRPRIKGRFVKKSELELYMAQQAVLDIECAVPAA